MPLADVEKLLVISWKLTLSAKLSGIKTDGMALHLIKLSVGSQSVDTLEDWVKERVRFNKNRGLGALHDHVTRMHPRRAEEILDGGSIYWVIKGVVLCRQQIVDIQKVTGRDGITRSALLMAPPLIRTQIQMRRAFQGWRYLPAEDAPDDLETESGLNPEEVAKSTKRSNQKRKPPPPELQIELAALGLL